MLAPLNAEVPEKRAPRFKYARYATYRKDLRVFKCNQYNGSYNATYNARDLLKLVLELTVNYSTRSNSRTTTHAPHARASTQPPAPFACPGAALCRDH